MSPSRLKVVGIISGMSFNAIYRLFMLLSARRAVNDEVDPWGAHVRGDPFVNPKRWFLLSNSTSMGSAILLVCRPFRPMEGGANDGLFLRFLFGGLIRVVSRL